MTKQLRTTPRLLAGIVAGTLGVGSFGILATPVSAQETAAIAGDQVPAPVRETARANYLNSTDVDYRKSVEGGELYQVNFTTPEQLRMQIKVGPDGKLLSGPIPAPNQPENAPRGAERERAATAWLERVRAPALPMEAQRAPAPVAPTPAPVPVPPTTPGAPAAPPADPINTEVRLADVPPDVVESAKRFTTGSKDVMYYKQSVEDRARYQVVYTVPSGSRQEVTIHENGSVINGPLTIVENVDDKALLADRPAAAPIATSLRVEPRDVPARVMDALSQYARAGTDVRYRRDTYPDGTVGYTAHWVQTNNNRRFFVTVGEDGTLRQAPQLSLYQPAGNNPGRADSGVAVSWDSLPDAVKRTLAPMTRNDRSATYYKGINDNKVSYGSVYTDNGRQMWVRVDEAGTVVVNPVSAKTGRPVAEEPQQAASQIPAAQMRDRVTFADLPKPVQTKVLKETDGAKDVVNMRHNRDGKTVFHSSWTDGRGQRKELWLDDSGEAVPVVTPGR